MSLLIPEYWVDGVYGVMYADGDMVTWAGMVLPLVDTSVCGIVIEAGD